MDMDDLMRVKDRLEELKEQIEEVLSSAAELGEFKEHLRAEYARTSVSATLSYAERTWYRPIVQDIWTKGLSSARPVDLPGKLRVVLEEAKDQIPDLLSNLKAAITEED
jgi:hypothetical protein